MTKSISIVIPVYNNEPTLQNICDQIFDIHRKSFPHLKLELLFVNDGSKDSSWKELTRLRNLHKEHISLVNLSRNFGQFGALFAGFNHAQGDAVICISADLQDPVSLMAEMVKLWEFGVEIVVCHREKRQDGFFTSLFSRMAYAMARVSVGDLPQGGFDYWLMSRRVCKFLCSFKGRHNFIQGYLLSIGFSKAFIPYTRVERQSGRSGYGFWKKVKIFVDFFVDSSYLPIRMMSAIGAFISIAGLVYSVLIAYARYMNETPFPGWAPLMIMVMLIGGIIMVMLGVIGEYVWRIYDNLRDFPTFIVERKQNDSEDLISKGPGTI